jgi:hypothetical protein
LALGRAAERGLGNTMGLIGSLAIFYLATVNHVELTHAKIFSVLEVIIFLKYYIITFVLGIGLYY